MQQSDSGSFFAWRQRGTRSCVLAATAMLMALSASGSDAISADRKIAAGNPAQQGAQFSGRVGRARVVTKKSQVVELGQPYTSALIAESEIADVVPLSDHAIYLLGKKVGSTRLTVIGEGQRIQKIVEVEVTPDVDDLRAKLRENIPDSDIRVTSANEGVLLSGTALDAPSVEKAVAIAKRYAGEAITNAIMIASPQQVMLEVRFVEASRTASRELGVSTMTRGPRAAADTGPTGFVAAGAAIQAATMLSGTEPFGTLLARVLEGGTNVDVMIRALEERSLARRLAEPNLVTTSGDTASFLAGGEFPFPVSSIDNRISVEFKQFGIALKFTPTVLSGRLINLKIAPEVSDIDETAGVLMNSIRIPGLSVRRANTTVELKDGQSLAIAGLLQRSNRTGQQQLPWIGQVPVLGALFRSAEYQKNESDLVIIVTPRLVKPQRPGEQVATPLDNTKPGNDVDFFVNGRSEITKKDEERRREPKKFGHIIATGPENVTYAPAK